MCAYAGDILSGVLPGPYTDDDARRYARACLVPLELLERPELDIAGPPARCSSPPRAARRASRARVIDA